MRERNEIHPQTQPKPPRARRALNYQELKKIPVKLSLNLGATSGKTKMQQLHPSEMVHGIPGREGHGGAGTEGPGGSNFYRPGARGFWGARRPVLPTASGSAKRSQPQRPAGRLWEISGIAPWKTPLSPGGMPAFCLRLYGSLGLSPTGSLQGPCHGRRGGLDTLLAETSSARKPFGNTRACAGLVELLTLGTP